MTRHAFFPIAVFAALAHLPAPGHAESIELDHGRQALAPLTHMNLTLFPVVGGSTTTEDYLVLDEGMKSGQVRVKEKNRDGEVNELTLVNKSDRPLFLMAGEVIIGGKQDRIIGKNTVIEPKSTDAIPVFCVEHGRWSGRKAEFKSTGALAHPELRKKANHAGQSEVWQEVKSKNAKRGVANGTDTYRRVAQGNKVKSSIKGYKDAFTKALAKSPDRAQVNGFVVAMDGKVVAMETFASPALFRKLEDKILMSYYVEAVDAGNANRRVAAPKASGVKSFYNRGQAAKAKRQQILKRGKNATTRFEDAGLKGTTVERDDAEEGEAAVYESITE